MIARSLFATSTLLLLCTNAVGQDGECTVELTLSASELDRLNEAVSLTLAQELADYGVAAPLINVAPVADGVIGDGEYTNTCSFSFADRENPGNPYPPLDTIEDPGDEDLSLLLHLNHTDEYLFMGYEVTDEFLDLDEGTDPFRNDSVELFLNPDLDVEDFNIDVFGRNAGGEGMQLVADAAGGGDIDFNNRSTSGDGPVPVDTPDPGELEFYTAGLPSDAGWIVEWQIPLSSLDTDSDENATIVPAKTGDVMLMNFAINDNDEEGANGQDTHAMMWVVEDDPRSPFGGGENVWVVPLKLTQSAGEVQPQLEAGDADRDLDFDQLDLVAVQIAAKYLTGQPATWGEGDWNGAPGGSQDSPPAGDGSFNQLDIISALGAGKYLTGPYAAIASGGNETDEQTSLVYDPGSGELRVNAPTSKDLTSINITSAGSLFVGDKPAALDGAFDNFAADNIFKATFGGSFGSITFGNVLDAGIAEDTLLADLSAVGSLAGGGDLGDVDLIYLPEPTAMLLIGLGFIASLFLMRRRHR